MIFRTLSAFLLSTAGYAQTLPMPSVDLSAYSVNCKAAVLKKIGWSFQQNTGEEKIESPKTCQANSNTELRNYLKISLPSSLSEMDPGDSAALLEDALLSAGTQCSFQNSYVQAVESSTQKLKNNHLYIFSPFWTSDNMRLGTLKDSWNEIPCDGSKCYAPKINKNSIAIDSLYSSAFSSDCAVGLQLAENSALRELFGTNGFNKSFLAEELFVGDWGNIDRSASLTHGKKTFRILPQDGLLYAQAGHRSFIGLTGYLGSVFDASHLDDAANRGENFMIVRTSAVGSTQFKNKGGLSYYTQLFEKVWALSQKVTPQELQVLENISLWGKLAETSDISIQQKLPSEPLIITKDESVEIAHLLSDPFLTETKIYVHPMGLRPIAWHILRLARINPRTPYKILFYSDPVHTEIFDRWLKFQLDTCDI